MPSKVTLLFSIFPPFFATSFATFFATFLTILFAGPKRGYWAERKEANYLVINFQLSPSLRMY